MAFATLLTSILTPCLLALKDKIDLYWRTLRVAYASLMQNSVRVWQPKNTAAYGKTFIWNDVC
jgi:hypothetical protein